MTRQAEVYRNRRVLSAGDAAHVHSPMGRVFDRRVPGDEVEERAHAAVARRLLPENASLTIETAE